MGIVLAATLLSLLAAGAGGAGADTPLLVGDVGANDSFAISLVDGSGVKVKHVEAGTYTLLVHDRSVHHNFHLTGPGVNVATDVEGTGDQTFTITIGDGVYLYVCDPHAVTMRGVFTAGSVTAVPPVNLTGVLSGRSRSTLTPLGSTPPSGPYLITVHDRSPTDGFRLSGPGVSRSTGAHFTGTVKWTVTLRKGTYEYGSVASPKLRKVFSVYG